MNINNINLNHYFDEIYCLNLDRRKDRLEVMQERFDHFGIKFKRMPAIDAKNFSELEEKQFKKFKKFTKKELCCALGHASIYRDARSNGYERILVFEDDVMFVQSFNEKIQRLKSLDWDIVLLGSSNFKPLPKITNGFYNPKRDWGAFAYAVSKRCYEKLLDWIDKDGYDVADHITIRYFNQHSDRCFVYYPNICIADVCDSDMRAPACQATYAKKVKWDSIKERLI